MTNIPIKSRHSNRVRPPYQRGLLLNCLLGMTLTFNTACQQGYSPKPSAFPRIDYPKMGYIAANKLPYPITFDYPAFATLEFPSGTFSDKKWLNINFDRFQAKLFISYYRVNGKTIQQLLLENEAVLSKQVPPLSRIRKQEYQSEDHLLEGFIYEVDGNSANPLQFILTDKHEQLFRGALYFNYIPNRDSIKNILDGLTGDIRHLMESFKFKQ